MEDERLCKRMAVERDSVIIHLLEHGEYDQAQIIFNFKMIEESPAPVSPAEQEIVSD